MVRPGGVLYGLWRDILDPAHRDVETASRDVAAFSNYTAEVGAGGRDGWIWLHV